MENCLGSTRYGCMWLVFFLCQISLGEKIISDVYKRDVTYASFCLLQFLLLCWVRGWVLSKMRGCPLTNYGNVPQRTVGIFSGMEGKSFKFFYCTLSCLHCLLSLNGKPRCHPQANKNQEATIHRHFAFQWQWQFTWFSVVGLNVFPSISLGNDLRGKMQEHRVF